MAKRKKVKAKAKVKKAKAKKASRRSRRAKRKMVTHRHAATVRHISKGAKAKAKIRKGKAKLVFRRGKKKVRVSARIAKKKSMIHLKVNPRRKVKRRKNPETNIQLIAKKIVGKTKSGKNKYEVVHRERIGSQPTRGEVKYVDATSSLVRESARFAKGKKAKAARRKKADKLRNKAKKMKAQRAHIKGLTSSMKETMKTRGYRISRKGTIKKLRKNPFGGSMEKVEKLLGTSMVEVGGLAAGGLLYGAVNAAAAKYAKPVHAQLAKIPVVGTALPTLLIGALANYLGERQGIEALKVVGKGLVGASVVGMGVNASQMVPMLRPAVGVSPVAGLGYEEMYGLPEGLGNDADFGSDADFGGVDYTMEGVDYTMEGQMGDDADFGGVDYTMEGLPEGMGEGQLG